MPTYWKNNVYYTYSIISSDVITSWTIVKIENRTTISVFTASACDKWPILGDSFERKPALQTHRQVSGFWGLRSEVKVGRNDVPVPAIIKMIDSFMTTDQLRQRSSWITGSCSNHCWRVHHVTVRPLTVCATARGSDVSDNIREITIQN